MLTRPRALAACAAASALLLAGCGGDAEAEGGGDGSLEVVASFYPLAWATERVVGDRASVRDLTPAGAEPHDLELDPRDVARLSDADLVVYLDGFQPSVDEAVAQQAADRGLDVTSTARLDLEGGHEHEGETWEEHAEHADEEEHAGEEHAKDPHFWLDPDRLGDVAGAIAIRLSELDPEGATTYRANALALDGELHSLAREYETGLASCTNKELVTSHEAFGYLAQRFGLEQVGVAGISPEQEPDAASLARVADFVREHGVRTIYTETLSSPAVARTVAEETGATTALLDPIEGLTDASEGRDYLDVMRSNLKNLQNGQPCP